VSRPVFRPRAVRDLDQIWAFTAERWGVAQAERYLGAIRDVCAALAAGEATGTDASHISPGYRRIRAGRHIVFFRPASGTVEIVRILHERMDFPSQLRE
jgi:toxin ParE1/3/4